MLELRAREQTGGAIRALLNLAPKTAHRLKDDGRTLGWGYLELTGYAGRQKI